MGESTAAAEKMLQNLKNGTASFSDLGNTARGAATDVMNFGKQAAQGMDEFTAGIDRSMSAFKQYEATREAAHQREQARQKAEAAAWDKRLGRDSEKFSVDEKGNRIAASVESEQSITQRLLQMGVTEEMAASMAPSLVRQWQRMALGTGGKLLGTFTQVGTTKTWDQVLREAAAGAGNTLGGVPAQPMPQPALQPQQQPQAAKTYNVVINGQTYKADSDAAAKSLIEALTRAQQSS